MINNNKILTVSYGTFSCTLEGFEDSFGTMKAIAEYFRDLAADDRYFGAEPPQPDAEMLARIAEREVSRRVEAREQDGKIVLSAVGQSEGQASALPQLVSDEESSDRETAPEAAAPEHKGPDDASQTEAAEIDLNDVLDQSNAPATASVEGAATEEEPAGEVISTAALNLSDAFAGLSPQPVPTTQPPAAEPIAATPAPAALAQDNLPRDEGGGIDIVPGQPDAEVEAFFAAQPAAEAEDAVEDTPAPAAAPRKAQTGESIADKLQRIRAVVAQRKEDAADVADYSEDQHADSALSAAAVKADTITAVLDEVEEITTDPGYEEAEDDIGAILNRLESTLAEDTAAAPAKVDPAAPLRGQDTVNNLFEETDLEDEAAPQSAIPAPIKPATDKPKAAQARVIKVKRAELEKAVSKGLIEEETTKSEATAVADTGPTLDDIAPSKRDDSSLSPEDEAELARELAELEADIARGQTQADAQPEDARFEDGADEDTAITAEAAEDAGAFEPAPEMATLKGLYEEDGENDFEDEDDLGDDFEDETEEEIASAPAPEEQSKPRKRLPDLDEGEDADMSRLLAEADQQMDDPGGANRREAFAHLRAAVAAKKADTSMDHDETESDGAYRNDLADVVRPRRPVAGQTRSERPQERPAAPLKLVAEQRVDTDGAAAKVAGTVRPRRVAARVDPTPVNEDGESFAEFAEDMGAHTLPELLEAAAAYLSFVEGRDQFSRPQLMTKVRQIDSAADFSREEGLRTFGQLLRKGKIQKLRGGRFTVSDDIGFRPDEREAG